MLKIRYSILQIHNFPEDEAKVISFLEDHKREILETGFIQDVVIERSAKHPLLGSLITVPSYVTIFVIPKSDEDLEKYDAGPRPAIKDRFDKTLLQKPDPMVMFIDARVLELSLPQS